MPKIKVNSSMFVYNDSHLSLNPLYSKVSKGAKIRNTYNQEPAENLENFDFSKYIYGTPDSEERISSYSILTTVLSNVCFGCIK